MDMMIASENQVAPKEREHFVRFKVKCYATYHSTLPLPDSFFENGNRVASDDEILTYVRTHLPEANVKDLEYLEDLEDICDSVWQEDIREVS